MGNLCSGPAHQPEIELNSPDEDLIHSKHRTEAGRARAERRKTAEVKSYTGTPVDALRPANRGARDREIQTPKQQSGARGSAPLASGKAGQTDISPSRYEICVGLYPRVQRDHRTANW